MWYDMNDSGVRVRVGVAMFDNDNHNLRSDVSEKKCLRLEASRHMGNIETTGRYRVMAVKSQCPCLGPVRQTKRQTLAIKEYARPTKQSAIWKNTSEHTR